MLVLPLALAWFTAALLMVLDGRRRWVGWLAVVALAAMTAALVGLAIQVTRDGPVEMVTGGWPADVGIRLRADALGVLFAVLAVSLLLTTLLYEVLVGIRERALPALLLFLSAGLTGLFLTGDVFNFYVFFEVSMAASFVLASYGQEARQMRDAVTFMVVNLLGTVFFLTGIAALYRLTGSLDMDEIAAWAGGVERQSALLVATLFFVAFSVKLGLFPFHFWLPPVYRGARPGVAAVLSGVLANIGSYGLLRFGAGLLPREVEMGRLVLLTLGTASIIYGGVLAVASRSASGTLAYSSISQAGYILLGLGVGGPIGLASAILAAVVNAVDKTLLFLCTSLRGRLVGTAFALGAFSVAGVPPALGFFGKAAVFRAGIAADSATLVAASFLGGALALGALFRVYQRDYWAEPTRRPDGPLAAQVLVFTLAVVLVILGAWPEPVLGLTQRAAAVLIGGQLP